MNIRPERPDEYAALHDLIKTAFQTAPVSDGDEQDFADRLRRSPGYIPELALVAEENGERIGHIMLTQISLKCADKTHTELLLAPICVALSHRNKGVGSALVNEAFVRAKKLGYDAVFLVGAPEYYGRFGFKQTTGYGIANESKIPDHYVMACELHTGALQDKQGSISIV